MPNRNKKKSKKNKKEKFSGTFSKLIKEVDKNIKDEESFRIKYIPPDKQKLLFEVCEKSKNPVENSFILYAGLTGLREGAVLHMNESWVDYNEQTIRVPRHDPCCCNYCYRQFISRMKNKGATQEHIDQLTDEIVKKYYWRPKTINGAREFYFGYLKGFDIIMHQFFKKHKKILFSRSTLIHRIKNLYKQAGLEGYIVHDLRSTSATEQAKMGLNSHQLKSNYGWKNSKMADTYVQMCNRSGIEATKKATENKNIKSLPLNSTLIWYPTHVLRKLLTRRRRKDDIQWLEKVLFEKNQVNETLKIEY